MMIVVRIAMFLVSSLKLSYMFVRISSQRHIDVHIRHQRYVMIMEDTRSRFLPSLSRAVITQFKGIMASFDGVGLIDPTRKSRAQSSHPALMVCSNAAILGLRIANLWHCAFSQVHSEAKLRHGLVAENDCCVALCSTSGGPDQRSAEPDRVS